MCYLRSSLLLLSLLFMLSTPAAAAPDADSVSDLRSRVLTEIGQELQFRESLPETKSTNPYDFVGIAHNRILHRGLKDTTSLVQAQPVEYWSRQSRDYLAALDVSQAAPILHQANSLMDSVVCPKGWIRMGPVCVDPRTILFPLQEAAVAPRNARMNAAVAHLALLYGTINRPQLKFAVGIVSSLDRALNQTKSHNQVLSQIQHLENEVSTTQILSEQQKAPLLISLAIARHSYTFHSNRSTAIRIFEEEEKEEKDEDSGDLDVEDVMWADFGGAISGAGLGASLGGPWGAAVGGAIVGAISSGKEISDQSSTIAGGSDSGTDTSNVGDFHPDDYSPSFEIGSDQHLPSGYGELEAGAVWTDWLNRDTPGGKGDFESLSAFVSQGLACSAPIAIECRLRGQNVNVATGKTPQGETYTCSIEHGGTCDNRRQEPGVRCSDYEVRFLCPPKK